MAGNPVIRAPELKLETEKKKSETTVRPTGRITLNTNAVLENAVRDLIAQGGPIVLDMANVDYIDSAGLGTLVSVYMHARRANCNVKIANPKQRIRDLFNRSGLASVFDRDSFDTLWEAWSSGGGKGK